MLTINNNGELSKIIQELLNDYASTCRVEPFNGKIIITDNIQETYMQLRKDLIDLNKTNVTGLERYHGLTVQPANVDGAFTIVLNQNYIIESINNQNIDWVGTLIHEAVHVNDFKDYFNIVLPSSYDELYDYNLHRPFLYWTEFHARAIGHYFLRKYTLEDFENNAHIENLINIELPFQINYMTMEVNKTNDADRQMYVIVHFLGRLAVWQYLYPEIFNSEFIDNLMHSNPWMKELYDLFKRYKTLNEIFSYFNEIQNILDRHFL